jgi:hypothetical protein
VPALQCGDCIHALDDALLHLRTNVPTVGTLLLHSTGDGARVLQHDWRLREHMGSGGFARSCFSSNGS